MRRIPSASRSLSCALLLTTLLLAMGCQVPGYDLEEELLHDPAIVLEPRFGRYEPFASGLDGGPSYGVKTSYEYAKNFYISLDFTYAEVDGNDSDFLTMSPFAANGLRNTEEEVLSESNRIAFVISADFDIPLFDTENPWVPYLRLGFGPGVLLLKNDIDKSLESAFLANTPPQSATVDDKVVFLLRPTASLRWKLSKDISAFGEVYYDYAMSSLSVDVDGDNVHTDQVDMSGVTYLFGLSFKFW